MIKNHPALSGREEEARVCLASAFSFSLFAFIYIYIYILGPHPQQMEVPSLGVEAELYLPA